MIKKFLVQYSILSNLKKFNHKTLTQILDSQSTSSFLISRAISSSKFPMELTLTIKRNDELRSKAQKICSDNLGGVWTELSPHEISLIPIRYVELEPIKNSIIYDPIKTNSIFFHMLAEV